MCPTPTSVSAPVPTPLSQFSLTFPPEPCWVRAARDAVRTALGPVLDAESVESATLLTSELVTNAVVASARAPISVHGEWTPTGTVRVLVHDRAPGTPELPARLPSPETDEHGRGLLLISLLATDWGVCHHAPGLGKIVWFTLCRNAAAACAAAPEPSRRRTR
ncbi:ATP-binding protein [Streptomyces sp. 4N509B]|uniref:ATP-binding protein n=1 Tax=Streptomyces sp. 4N509B TaxID=3457413 RepID=UPI003FD3A228